ncbi:MAG TPA: SagB/ThcOx family dehydrogenase [Aggregatilineales bacterium]|nr:SagB/ThcOx family dehydrogenase [Aggregatilineales bacterium]
MKTIAIEFMKQTSLPLSEPSGEQRGDPQPPLAWEPAEGAPVIDLPAPPAVKPDPVDLPALFEARRTVRRYADTPLTLAELSYLLWATQGVKLVTPRPVTLRTVPSAGARHAFETVLLVNRVEGLEPGFYQYAAMRHQVAPLRLGAEQADRLAAACLDQPHVVSSAVTFVWVANVERMVWRYGLRGYRYLHLDAGHVCQNLYLAAESIGCGVCALAAFEDRAVNELLGLDGESQFAIYMGTLGKRAEG